MRAESSSGVGLPALRASQLFEVGALPPLAVLSGGRLCVCLTLACGISTSTAGTQNNQNAPHTRHESSEPPTPTRLRRGGAERSRAEQKTSIRVTMSDV